MEINIEDFSSTEVYHYLTHLVAPRPVALVSTISADGVANLSPFSFFNIFSCNPPVLIFSPLRRMRDNTIKHTLHNVMEVPEVVINIVTSDIAGQASLASSDYKKGVDEFIKAGFEKEKAAKVRPPMVRQAKAKLECRVTEVKPLGTGGSAGNLVICEVLFIHITDEVLTGGSVDPAKLRLAARMGGDFYTEILPDNLFTLPRPGKIPGIGMDCIPAFINALPALTPNDLARLAMVERIPVFAPEFTDHRINSITRFCRHRKALVRDELCRYVSELLNKNEVQKAWQVLGKLEPGDI